MALMARLQHAWNAFMNRDGPLPRTGYGLSYTARPDRPYFRVGGNERSIISSIYTRIAVDVAQITFQHVRLDQNGRFLEEIKSDLDNCLNLNANADQTAREFIQDIVMSLCDEGCVAVVITDADLDPKTNSFKIQEMRVGQILQWWPEHIQVRLFNEKTGQKEDIVVPKNITAIVENPFYSVMNEPNSTLRRLISKLNILDAIDNQSGSGKLDIIVQMPYTIKTDIKRQQAEQRVKDIEMQLSGSKYGIAYADATEHITQLNRPVENNLMNQITYLTTTLYGQLGLTEEIMNGTASEEVQLNYYNRTIEPFCSAIVNAFRWKFLTKTARTQGQTIAFFRDPFRLVPVGQIAEIADKFTRNEIMTSNEIRAIIGYKPVDDPKADRLINSNLNQKETPGATGSASGDPKQETQSLIAKQDESGEAPKSNDAARELVRRNLNA